MRTKELLVRRILANGGSRALIIEGDDSVKHSVKLF